MDQPDDGRRKPTRRTFLGILGALGALVGARPAGGGDAPPPPTSPPVRTKAGIREAEYWKAAETGRTDESGEASQGETT